MYKEFPYKNSSNIKSQILLLERKNTFLKKQLFTLYDQYLKIIRDQISLLVKNSIQSLCNLSSDESNINYESQMSLFENDIDELVKQILPFLTIEQLCIPVKNNKNYLNKELNSVGYKFFIDNQKISTSIENKIDIYESEISNYAYYDSLLADNSLSIDLDNNNSKQISKYGGVDDREILFSLLDSSEKQPNKNSDLIGSEQNNNENEVSSELIKLYSWTNVIDSSILSYLQEFSFLVNQGLCRVGIIKKTLSDQVISLLIENEMLVSNPFPFIIHFDLNSNDFIPNNKIIDEINFSKIYLFKINPIEIEFNDLKLNLLRNSISDLKKELNNLIKKEKYWNSKKINNDLNKSSIT